MKEHLRMPGIFILCDSQADSLFTEMSFIQWNPEKEDAVSIKDTAYYVDSGRDC